MVFTQMDYMGRFLHLYFMFHMALIYPSFVKEQHRFGILEKILQRRKWYIPYLYWAVKEEVFEFWF